jgi:predicted component of type VI protein secretion system
MPFLEHDGLTRELTPGDTLVGSGPRATWRLQNDGLAARHFVIHLTREGNVTLRPYSAGHVVVVNGVQSPTDGVTLRHGDSIHAGGAQLRFLMQLEPPEEATASAGTRRPAGPAPRPAYLVDHRAGRAIALAGRRVKIGRHSRHEIVVRDPKVSRTHAEVRAEAGGYALFSFGSAGTKVNGERMAAPRMLADGDRIEIGDRQLVFAEGAAPDGVEVVEGESTAADEISMRHTVLLHAPGEERTLAPLPFHWRRWLRIAVVLVAIATVALLLLKR